MPKQFLLNADGSIPANVNVQALQEAGIQLVLPTTMPRKSGMVAVEQDPELVDGAWRQVWVLEPAPVQLPEEPIE
jgi:hypothetical protein